MKEKRRRIQGERARTFVKDLLQEVKNDAFFASITQVEMPSHDRCTDSSLEE
jgi:hypothetical protein